MLTFVGLGVTGAVVDPRLFCERVAVVKRALELSGLTTEKAALWMEMDKSQLHRQLQGEGHLSLTRMVQLPVAFWAWFGLLLVEECGLPREAQRAARVVLALLGRKRMAKALTSAQQRRSA
jgi:hypothetical protein